MSYGVSGGWFESLLTCRMVCQEDGVRGLLTCRMV